ncbi:MAG TPA: F0F1 ATP synthase subunit B [Chloroflexota bacterium]|nr:F0F1 ATP synthase subunit B [Chloroflexota bacterium]
MGALLGIDGPRLIFQIVNFLILLFLLQRLLFKPILRLMDQRATKIRESIDEAHRMQQLADEIREMNEKVREDAKRDANEILEGARRMAEQYEASERERARKEADLFLERQREEIQLERDRAIAEVRRIVVDLAIDAAGKVVEQKLNREDHVKLVEDFLAQTQAAGDGRV